MSCTISPGIPVQGGALVGVRGVVMPDGCRQDPHAADPPQPDISVLMIAYNQEAYIGEAIDSVLSQVTSCAWELVIGEDGSTDGTLAVAQAKSERNPQRIRILHREKNLGFTRNFLDVLSHCRGRYIAILEADDFWVDDGKLEFQFRYMEAHPEVSLCAGAVRIIEMQADGTCLELDPGPSRQGVFTTADLLETNPVHTPTAFLRAERIRKLPSGFYELGLLDWPTWIQLSLAGPVALTSQVLAAYRRHAGGVWSLRPEQFRLRATLELFALLPAIVPERFHPDLQRTQHLLRYNLGIALIRGGSWSEGWACLWPCLGYLDLWRHAVQKGLAMLAPGRQR